MLFKHEHLEKIYAGLKVRTRRLWKRPHARVSGIYPIKLKLFEKKNYGFIRVNAIRQENLLDITENEAWLEGGYTRYTFLEKWFEINPKSPENPELYVIDFQFQGLDPRFLRTGDVVAISTEKGFLLGKVSEVEGRANGCSEPR